MVTVARLTLTAVLPHAQVNLRDLVAAAVAMGQLSHHEHILLDACEVVPVVAQHSSQRRLLQLGQLGRSEHAWVFIPEPDEKMKLNSSAALLLSHDGCNSIWFLKVRPFSFLLGNNHIKNTAPALDVRCSCLGEVEAFLHVSRQCV